MSEISLHLLLRGRTEAVNDQKDIPRFIRRRLINVAQETYEKKLSCYRHGRVFRTPRGTGSQILRQQAILTGRLYSQEIPLLVISVID